MKDLDRLIDLAVSLDDEALLALADEGEDHVFSGAYNANMRTLFHKDKPRKHTRPWQYACASILIFATLAGVATAGAFWEEIRAFLQTFYAEYVDLGLAPDPNPSPPITDDTLNSWSGYWYPHYMTDSYSFYSASEQKRLKSIIFCSDVGSTIQFEQMRGSLRLGNDIEGTPVFGITIGGFEAFAFEKNIGDAALNTLVWSDASTSFRLIGQATLEELIKIAEHIVYVENTMGD